MSSIKTLYTDLSVWASIPNPLVAFPCGSMSINNTLLPLCAKQALKLTAVVVLPTPPFWLAIDITLAIMSPQSYYITFF